MFFIDATYLRKNGLTDRSQTQIIAHFWDVEFQKIYEQGGLWANTTVADVSKHVSYNAPAEERKPYEGYRLAKASALPPDLMMPGSWGASPFPIIVPPPAKEPRTFPLNVSASEWLKETPVDYIVFVPFSKLSHVGNMRM